VKLLPALKQKKRYIVFEIIAETKFLVPEVQKEVDSALLLFLGQLGLAKSSPIMLKEKFKNNKFIIKINHKYVDECITAMTLIKRIKNKDVIVRSIVTSGTIKKASSYAQ
jgi:RNase P/RNase MRP subunit POP5